MLLEGLQLPLTTPFYSDGRLNLRKLEYNVERYSKTPVAGLVALSGSGEATMLSEEEMRQVLRGVVEVAEPEKVLLAGVARDSVMGTLEMAEYAAGIGFDAVLVKQPAMFRAGIRSMTTKGLLTYFQAVADRSALPVVLYDLASDKDSMLPVEVVAELAGHPRIIGLIDSVGGAVGVERVGKLKDATSAVRREVSVTTVFAAMTGRMRVGSEAELGGLISVDTLTGGGEAVAVAPPRVAVKTRKKTVGFQILVADTTGMWDGLSTGAVGAMPAFAAAAPQACYEVLAAWKDGDEELAREKQLRLSGVAERVEVELGAAGIKYGCDLNGYYGGWPRLPLLSLTGEEQAEVEGLMQGLRN
jgi:4-hydroxy-2-oxoglutarate aldolase